MFRRCRILPHSHQWQSLAAVAAAASWTLIATVPAAAGARVAALTGPIASHISGECIAPGSCPALGSLWTIVNDSSLGDGIDSPYVPSGYVKVFGDEFREAAFDTANWWTRYIYGGPDGPGTLDFLNDEQQRYRENGNHLMSGRSLQLTANLTDPDPNDPVCCESGMIRSKTTFLGGYFEARIKMPPGLGTWGAFWLNSDERISDGLISWPPEIDIAEFVVNQDSTGDCDASVGAECPYMMHSGAIEDGATNGSITYTDPSYDQDYGVWYSPYLFDADYHIFGLLWDDVTNTVSFYVDGKLLRQQTYQWVYDDGTLAGYAHVLLDLAIGGSWAGANGIDYAAFPKVLEVDYVRVYQPIGRPQLGVGAVGLDLCLVNGSC